MGADSFGNRYYENRVDYQVGQHRWVEPADIHNFDAAQIPPEWHGWMTHQNDATPSMEQEYIEEKMKSLKVGEISHAPYRNIFGHQEPYFNFHGMHNQSQIRSRGYNIGNHVVGLPPGAPDAYYTQPGSPYNEHSIRKFEMQGSLDENRHYKNELWKERLMTPEEREAELQLNTTSVAQLEAGEEPELSPREQAILARGGTIAQSS